MSTPHGELVRLLGEAQRVASEMAIKSGVNLLHKAEKEFVIYGPASVAIVDREGDLITGPALKNALPQLLKAARLSLNHLDLIVGEILEKWNSPDGTTYSTEVREVTKSDFRKFSWLEKEGVQEGDQALFLVGKIWDDRQYSRDLQRDIETGKMSGFSISGQAIAASRKMICEGKSCKFVNEIREMALSCVTICENPMCPPARHILLSKSCMCECHGVKP